MSEIQAAWQARQHEVVTGRTRKGRTTQRVVKFNDAPIVGAWDRDCNGLPLLATTVDEHTLDPAGAAARVLTRREIRRMRLGWSALDVLAATEAAFGDQIPALLSTEVRQHSQVVSIGLLDGLASVASHTAGLTGGTVHGTTLDAFVAPTGANGTQTVKPWPTRRRLPALRARNGETFTLTVDGVTTLAAPSGEPGKRWQGHVLVTRPPVAARARRTARADRTVNAALIAPPATIGGWSELLAMLNRGERLACDGVTITRSTGGVFTARDEREGREHKWQARSADNLALKLV